ncbi:nuclease-related domain-containing protein [Microbacterium xanthum]|uniref:nuclease-related domain-containing protein n=1 Tax=Microbacterium xanthum TaxID=3079794 RepID=UPI002AD40FB5|nr:nuclease-related domain-containing protein [Microbacterium sp. KSW-48]MDZ8172419.1 nuclease-related domain-containing protein [Microbacterium sp. KSW-48]
MTATEPSGGIGTIPAAAVIAACLSAQSHVPRRSRAARAFGRSPLTEDSRPWYLGALGELQVAERLAKLGPDWTVLHSVPIGERGSDIDHALVGPAGVFTLNTKFHEDARIWVGSTRLLVNGQKTDHLRNSRYEAQRVAKKLTAMAGEPITVHPVVVLVGARSVTFRERPADVMVLRDTELVRWLLRRAATLEPGLRDRVAETLRRPETLASMSDTTANVDLSAFAALRHEVAAARRTRMLWGTVALLGGVALAATVAINTYATLLGG